MQRSARLQSDAHTILLVEDNHADALLTTQAFKQVAWPTTIHIVSSGEECLRFLRRQHSAAEARLPDLVLLDLNLPGTDGREVLQTMSEDIELAHIPVVVLSTSDNPEDILASYRLGCNSYVTKALDYNEFVASIQKLSDYWFGCVQLPSPSHITPPRSR